MDNHTFTVSLSQITNLSERIEANLYACASDVATAENESAVRKMALLAQGYVLGLLDAGAVTEDEAGDLVVILDRIENDTITRLSTKAQS